jgi:hypothetical protein
VNHPSSALQAPLDLGYYPEGVHLIPRVGDIGEGEGEGDGEG